MAYETLTGREAAKVLLGKARSTYNESQGLTKTEKLAVLGKGRKRHILRGRRGGKRRGTKSNQKPR